MTLTDLAKQLGVKQRIVRQWLARGLPHGRRGRAYDFDNEQVAEWLVEHGLAKTRRLAKTRGEVARFFEVSERTVGYWQARGMPGTPGDYDLDEIVAWREREGLAATDQDSARTLGQRIENEMKQLKLDQLRGELVAIEPVRRLLVRHIHEAKAVLNQLPDRVLAALPAAPPNKKEWPAARRRLRQQAVRIIDDACQTLADMLTAPEAGGSAEQPEEPDGS